MAQQRVDELGFWAQHVRISTVLYTMCCTVVFGYLAGLAVGALAISHQSFWMDEGNTAFKAILPTFAEWKFFTFRLGGSDVQMPAYMLLVWAWAKAGFLSEYALRLINPAPWTTVPPLRSCCREERCHDVLSG